MSASRASFAGKVSIGCEMVWRIYALFDVLPRGFSFDGRGLVPLRLLVGRCRVLEPLWAFELLAELEPADEEEEDGDDDDDDDDAVVDDADVEEGEEEEEEEEEGDDEFDDDDDEEEDVEEEEEEEEEEVL
jgi:hypothetical protein